MANVAATTKQDTLSFRLMSEDEKIHVDVGRPATLHNGPVSTDWPTLKEAIMLGTDSGLNTPRELP